MAQGFTRTTVGGTLLQTGSLYFITCSYSETSSVSLLAISASYSLSSSYTTTASYASFATSASYSLSSSYTTTASYSSFATSASYSSFASSASYVASASWAPSEGKVIGLCMAYTPTVTGSDAAEIPIPYKSSDGITPISWSVKRINFRTQTSESISSSITIEKSITGNVFSAISLGSLTLSGSLYETFTGSTGNINSGDKMRFNVNQLGTALYWTITVEVDRI